MEAGEASLAWRNLRLGRFCGESGGKPPHSIEIAAIQEASADGSSFSIYFAPTTVPGSGVPGINGSRLVAPRIASATVMCCTSSVRPIA
jgi:hypothetical protein